MSNYEPKEGSITLFQNDKKGNQNAPDYRGNGLFMGKKVKIAGWIKSGAKGQFISCKLEEDTYQRDIPDRQNPLNDPHPNKEEGGGYDFESDEIPFAPLKGAMIASY